MAGRALAVFHGLVFYLGRYIGLLKILVALKAQFTFLLDEQTLEGGTVG